MTVFWELTGAKITMAVLGLLGGVGRSHYGGFEITESDYGRTLFFNPLIAA